MWEETIVSTDTHSGEARRRLRISVAGIVFLALAIISGILAWRLVGAELTRARINTSAAFKIWLVSDKPLADVAFDRGPQVGSFILVEEKGKPARVSDKDNLEGLSNSEQKKYIVWRLSGAGYDMLYCTSSGMQANPARVGRRYAELSADIAQRFMPDNPSIPVLFAEPVRALPETLAIVAVPLILLLIGLYLVLSQAQRA